ncbi:hypothetical protein TNCV_690081 [Trichonephila clavipes]|nr:hypothetical protein TNCV_690081 [Trichonephila clavipes]
MVWGCMSSHGVGRLHIVSVTVKAMDYIEILQNKLLPTARDLFWGNQSWIFQDDNAPCHRAKIGLRTNRLANTFTKDLCVRITNTFKTDFLCLDNEHIFGGDQAYTPEIMDGIMTTARDLELEVNEDDIEDLIMGHEDELTTEELQEILNDEHTKKHIEMCLLLNKRKMKEDQCRHLPLKIF